MPTPLSTASSRDRIAQARVVVTSPTRNFVTLVVTTEDGTVGIGDATLNGRELAVAAYLDEHLVPLLVGRDAGRIEDTWQYLYRGAYWRGGPVGMSALAAVDTALWDIKAKRADLPLHQLLGGRSRDKVRVYGHATGETIEETVADVGRLIDLGYTAVRAQTAVPGGTGTYGVSRPGEIYDPAHGSLPEETVWDTRSYLTHVPRLFEALRDTYGFEIALLHDVHHRLTPIEAARLGASLEPYDLFWIEDPTPAEDQTAFRLIRQHTRTPIATGEVLSSVHSVQTLITERLVDYVRTTVTHAGGLTHLRRIFDLAHLYGVRSGSHGATDLSPVCLGAAVHLDTAIPNFGIQEYMAHSALTDSVFPHSYRFADGYLHVGEDPGHGVHLDEEKAAEHPYSPAYLPVARLADGSVHDW
ncbi:D-mannonate dehydratase ManD [Cellulomonas bogoriensis]|uniref:Bifunctional D-altronate/D-mannonate dehydratase n=1 Tax=Cellulomonas bogoriensis 69B4 = DSM 16987 TaxID=1386082 RepID=A0A0A0C195_9CELL|nr:D-mannonate dehydratase ManD [Cellulomonas bogoriensis]KGM14413.1 bifunctional D-altronate/D-mannonate dehydratase [Cellulomonas bogoriensis 69B4 = DSM 16987]